MGYLRKSQKSSGFIKTIGSVRPEIGRRYFEGRS
jgi:hypothetical protein